MGTDGWTSDPNDVTIREAAPSGEFSRAAVPSSPVVSPQTFPGGSPEGAALVLRRLSEAVSRINPLSDPDAFESLFDAYSTFAADCRDAYSAEEFETICLEASR